MCGIIGASKNSIKSEDFIKASQTLNHRGPDYTGTYEDDFLRMHHLLLAIRGDISESIQPVEDADSPWVVAFNGQLYNTTSIKKNLGIMAPSSEVDTVLLYALIKKYGWDFIDYIQGMFAIALYHKQEKVIRLYRDQSGQKNLYYALSNNCFMFASELRGLLAFDILPRIADQLSIQIATSIGYIPGNRTLIEGIRKLNPSEEISFDFKTHALTSRVFQSTGKGEYEGLTPAEAMQQTIVDHLQSKRDISINLSGGLDSSLIFFESMQEGRNVRAFSTRFETSVAKYNTDALLAERLARDWNQTFIPIEITGNSYLNHFIEAYRTIEEPNYNISIPIYYQTAKTEGIHGEGLRVVLSGDGGDELFGGYPHYREVQRIEHLKKIFTPFGLTFLKRIKNGDPTNYKEISEIFMRLRKLPQNWIREQDKNVYTYIKEITDTLLPPYQLKDDDVYRAMLLDRFIWLASENFIRSDKLYMSQSMEMRCPLAYTPLRTYMDTQIESSKYISNATNKIFLRKLYEKRLPDYITHRQDKTGWRAPIETWYDKKYKDFFLEIITTVEHQQSCIDWKKVKQHIERSDTWPGKVVHLYLSLAILLQEYDLV